MKKTDYAIEALRTIADGVDLSADDLRRIAADGIVKIDGLEKRRQDKLVDDVANFLISTGNVFLPAEEIANLLNATELKPMRSKTWSKSTATAIMQDVRPAVSRKLMDLARGVTPSVAPAVIDELEDDGDEDDVTETVEQADATVAAVKAIVAEQPKTITAPLTATVAAPTNKVTDDLDDELSELITELGELSAA